MTERLKQLLTLSAIALTSLIFVPLIAPPRSSSVADISLYITSLTGLMGVVLLLWQYMLGTRTVTGLIYRDLAWTMKIHTWLGIYGTLLIFLHPVASLLAYGQNVLYLFVPNLSTEYETAITWGRIGLVVLLVVWVTSALIRGNITYRPWKYLHYLSYIVLPVTFLHSQDIGITLLTSRPAQIYWYSLIAVFGVGFLLRARFLFGFGKSAFRIIESSQYPDTVQEIKLEPLQRKLALTNGQYLYLQPNLLSEEHPFSAFAFDKQGTVTVAFKRVGKFTHKLAALPVGSVVLVDGPYGSFTQEVSASPNLPAVFISGGIGVTPFYQTIMQGHPEQLHYHFDCNAAAGMSLLSSTGRQHLGSKYISVLSNDSAATGPNVEHGYISADIITKYIEKPQTFNYYVCGPPVMMEHTHAMLRSLGIADRQIRMEKFSL
jgi:predicted ferric reductase